MAKYFAKLPASELASELKNRYGGWKSWIEKSGAKEKMEKSFKFYYGNQWDGQPGIGNQNVLDMGEQGELKGIHVNDFRNIIRNILILTTSQKTAYEPRASNGDPKSMQRTKIAKIVLENYLYVKRLNRYLNLAAEQSLVMTKGFVMVDWNDKLGKPIDTRPVFELDHEGNPEMDELGQPKLKLDEDGEPLKQLMFEGDLDYTLLDPRQVHYDHAITDWRKNPWVEVITWENKFDLAAQYPNHAEAIENFSFSDNEFCKELLFNVGADESTMIPVRRFIHKPTLALPAGRDMKFLDSHLILSDTKYRYAKDGDPNGSMLNVFRVTPSEVFNSGECYSDSYDLIVLQEVQNILYSAAFTNNQAFGVQGVVTYAGTTITHEAIGRGLVNVKVSQPGMEPKPLQLTNTPAELFKLTEMVGGKMETISGVNAAARGAPDFKNMSGKAIGLVQSMAAQYASGFQQSLAEFKEDVASLSLFLFRKFAKNERAMEMSGKMNKHGIGSFKGDDIEGVERVIIDLGNALSQTVAGRADRADKWLESGMIKTPQEYITVEQTGNLEPMIEAPLAQSIMIRQENEDLLEGKHVIAMIGDAQLLHAQEHLVVLYDPELRRMAQNGDQLARQILTNATQHIQEHMNLWKTQHPEWAAVTGEQPAPPPPMPPMGPPPPGMEGPALGPQDMPPPPQDPNQPPMQ